MTNEQVLTALVDGAEAYGVDVILALVFHGKGKVRLPLSGVTCGASIDELDLSVRGANAMKRTSIFTVGALVDLVMSGELLYIRNLGKKTEKEIKTKLLLYCYDALTKSEKRGFFAYLLRENGYTH